MSAHVVSVNVGTPVDVSWAGSVGRTAIRKRPTTGPVRVHALGLEGDEVADKRDHGGIDQAVYAFAQEDLDFWTEQLGERVPPALFGENLTTSGIDVNEAQLGEQWRVGSVLLQVSSVRIPCSTFQNHLALEGFDETGWVKRFTAQKRPGPYLKVVEEGTLAAGDDLVVTHRPDHGVTVSTMFAALTTDRSLLPELLRVDDLPDWVHAKARAYQG